MKKQLLLAMILTLPLLASAGSHTGNPTRQVTACQVEKVGAWYAMFYIGFQDEPTARIWDSNAGRASNPHPSSLPEGEGGGNSLSLITVPRPQGTNDS